MNNVNLFLQSETFFTIALVSAVVMLSLIVFGERTKKFLAFLVLGAVLTIGGNKLQQIEKRKQAEKRAKQNESVVTDFGHWIDRNF